MDELPPALLAYVIHCVGTPVRADALAGTTASVWRIALADGRKVVVKCCGPGRAFAQELAGLAQVAALGDVVPQVLGSSTELRAIVSSNVGGADVVGNAAEIWRAAGTLRAAFDRIELADADPCPIERAIALRFEHWLGRAARHLDGATLVRARAAIDPRMFAGRTRQLCHRDFGPHNWRVDPDRTAWLGCVDFGHARADDPLVDLVRACAPPAADPALRAAFLDGWGITLDDRDAACLRQLEWLHAIATATWGREHGDRGFAALGDAALASCE